VVILVVVSVDFCAGGCAVCAHIVAESKTTKLRVRKVLILFPPKALLVLLASELLLRCGTNLAMITLIRSMQILRCPHSRKEPVKITQRCNYSPAHVCRFNPPPHGECCILHVVYRYS